MAAVPDSLIGLPLAYVAVCDECGVQVTTFKLNEQSRAACVPCGHPARVSLVPSRKPFDGEAE